DGGSAAAIVRRTAQARNERSAASRRLHAHRPALDGGARHRGTHRREQGGGVPMKVLVIGKFPPIEGGVSAQTYWFCTALAQRGHQIEVITDAAEVEDEYRIWLRRDDLKRLNASYEGGGQVRVRWTKPWDEHAWRHVPAGN